MVQDYLMMEIDNGSNGNKASIGGGVLLGDECWLMEKSLMHGELIDGKASISDDG